MELLLMVDFSSLMMSLPLCAFCLYRSCVLMAVSRLLRRYWCYLLAEFSRGMCLAYFWAVFSVWLKLILDTLSLLSSSMLFLFLYFYSIS
jgi:hypothetical protein